MQGKLLILNCLLTSGYNYVYATPAPDATTEKHLILHSILTGLDFSIAIILMLAVLNGLTTGVIMKLGQIVAVIVSYAVAAFLASQAGFAHAVVFVPAFIVMSIVCHYLVGALGLVDRIPIVGALDKYGGAIVNFIVAFIVIYYVANLFLNGIIPQETLDSWGWTRETLNKTIFISSLII
ncbi:MAG: CvpA family protein [Lachnospiraceae bacterium]|nr:CvpA family protein [Lachnospiraceae bacterium]